MSIRPEWWHCLDLSSVSIKHWSINGSKFMVNLWAKFKLIWEYKFPLQYSDLTTIYFVSTEECWSGSNSRVKSVFDVFIHFPKSWCPDFITPIENDSYEKLYEPFTFIDLYWNCSHWSLCGASYCIWQWMCNYALSHSTSAAGVKRRTYFLYFQKKLNQYSLSEFLI